MRKYKVFISGVQKELKVEGRAVKDFVESRITILRRAIM